MGAISTLSKHGSQDLALGLARLQALVLALVLGIGIVKPSTNLWYGITLAFALALNILFLWVEYRGRRAAIRQDESRNSAIDALYKELHQLMSRQEPGLEGEIERKLARLRSLQREEAAAMRQRFEASLHLKPGEGWQALSEARRLLSENENRPSANSPIQRQA
jgi:hypothetical protein